MVTSGPRKEATDPCDTSHPDRSTEQPQARTEPPKPSASKEERPNNAPLPKNPAPITVNVNLPNPPPDATESDPTPAGPGVDGATSESDPPPFRRCCQPS